jgi:hypothetical protein
MVIFFVEGRMVRHMDFHKNRGEVLPLAAG